MYYHQCQCMLSGVCLSCMTTVLYICLYSQEKTKALRAQLYSSILHFPLLCVILNKSIQGMPYRMSLISHLPFSSLVLPVFRHTKVSTVHMYVYLPR